MNRVIAITPWKLLVLLMPSGLAALKCYQCSSQSEQDCADPFSVPAAVCQHSEPRGRSLNGSRDDLSADRFLESCPVDGRAYFCLKTWQVEMGAVLVTRSCGWEEEDRQDNCTTEEWGGRDYVTMVCSCYTEACNSGRRTLASPAGTAAMMAAILYVLHCTAGQARNICLLPF